MKRLKAAEKKAPTPPSPYDSRMSLVESRSPTPQDSMSSNGTDPNKAAIDKEYLRNVLIQFFEHKDKRVTPLTQFNADDPAQLLPVLSMLLNFSKADEMKLLR